MPRIRPEGGTTHSGSERAVRPPGRSVVGLDLAGSPKRDTGGCELKGPRRLRTAVLHSDDEVLDFVSRADPELVVIDAPLSLPRGRRTIEDRSGPHLRECDRELLRRRIPFFPITLGPMRVLTTRGMELASELRVRGFSVLEGYPGGAQDLLGLPRKNAGIGRLQRGLRSLGLGGDLEKRPLTHDELDAVTIAWVGWNFRKGRGELIGDPTEGTMVLPLESGASTRRRRAPSRPGSAKTRRRGPRSSTRSKSRGAEC